VLEADAERLAAVAEVCRARADFNIGYSLAVELAEAGFDAIRQTGADRSPRARRRLVADLKNQWETTPHRQRLWHRHRLPRRVLRRLDPRWWYGHWRAAREVQMVYHPARKGPTDYHEIELLIGDREVGSFQFKPCRTCRIGYVAKISIDSDQQGKGLGTRALAEARRHAPGYHWWTSGQHATARTFWERMARRTGDEYQFASRSVCPHMKE
jgi:GNAT superfamily N-acetyltransferase